MSIFSLITISVQQCGFDGGVIGVGAALEQILKTRGNQIKRKGDGDQTSPPTMRLLQAY